MIRRILCDTLKLILSVVEWLVTINVFEIITWMIKNTLTALKWVGIILLALFNTILIISLWWYILISGVVYTVRFFASSKEEKLAELSKKKRSVEQTFCEKKELNLKQMILNYNNAFTVDEYEAILMCDLVAYVLMAFAGMLIYAKIFG